MITMFSGLAAAALAGAVSVKVEKMPALPSEPLTIEYPGKCIERAEALETVSIHFDIAVDGTTENVSALTSTNQCLNEAALRAVEDWTFWLLAKPGVTTDRKGVQVVLSFDRVNAPGSPDRRIRRGVGRRLAGVEKHLSRNKPPQKALARLDKIEARFGDRFSLAETTAFRVLRGEARIETADYDGALDDLRVALEAGLLIGRDEAVTEAIAKLESEISQKRRTPND